MGLWLKCPGCQAQNPLSLKVCPHCGRDLDKLPAAQRVYVMGPAPTAAPAKTKPAAAAASRAGAPSPEPGAAPKPVKKSKRAKKKS